MVTLAREGASMAGAGKAGLNRDFPYWESLVRILKPKGLEELRIGLGLKAEIGDPVKRYVGG